MTKPLSLRAFAKQLGVSHQAVSKAIKAGRLSRSVTYTDAGHPKVALELGLEEWRGNTDPAQVRQPDSRKGGRPPASSAQPAEEAAGAATAVLEAPKGADGLPEDPPREEGTYASARAIREHYQARLAALDFQQRQGELVNGAEVRATAFRHHRTLRDQLLNIPDRLAAELAACPDEHQVHVRLLEEITTVLSDLSHADA